MDQAARWERELYLVEKLMNMFPGESTAIVYLEDQKKKLQTRCIIHDALLAELRETLGEESVVLKAKQTGN